MTSLLASDETANDLFRRLDKKGFTLRMSSTVTEELFFQEMIEVVAQPNEVAEFILSAALEFAAQVEDGMVLHVSMGNNLHRSLCLSGMDISALPLYHLAQQGGVKACSVHTMSQLLALAEYLRTSIHRQKVLVLIEGVSCLFSSQKALQGTLPATALVHGTLSSFQKLSQLRSVTTIWVNSSSPKGSGLREGNFRDPVTALWKAKITKVHHYSPTR